MKAEDPQEKRYIYKGCEFVFLRDFPASPTADFLMQYMLETIEFLPASCELAPLVKTIYLSCTVQPDGVKGTAYDAMENPIISLTYSFDTNAGWAGPFSSPTITKPSTN